MNINTSNTLRQRDQEQRYSNDYIRRQVNSSSNFREINQQSQGNYGNFSREENTHANQAYRSVAFPGQINFDELLTRRDVLQELLSQFRDRDGRVVFQPYKKDQYSKRLLLLQQQIDGLMRQTYMFNGKDRNGKVRTIDYTNLLVEKQNQVNQLERKIAHLESQLRMRDQRQKDLEDQLQRRFNTIKIKNDEIQRLRNAPRSFADLGKSLNQGLSSYIRNLTTRLDQLSKRGGSMAQLQNQVEGWIMSLPQDSQLKKKLRSADQKWLQQKYKKYISYLTTEAGSLLNSMTKLYTNQIQTLKSKGTIIQVDPRIIEITSKQIIPRSLLPTQEILMSNQVMNSKVGSNVGSLTNIINSSSIAFDQIGYMNGVRKVVEIPVQDARTKALIYKLATQMKRLYTKYPSLSKQISPQLSQLFSQQVIDMIEVDGFDHLIQIVKYRPEIVKVENVYAYSSEKSRKVEFHLRVLIKALLQQMQRIRIKTGIQPQIDEGVIGMIRQQIMDFVDVDDILKVYRTVPKIVQVQKVVQKVVQKIVQVPHYVAVQTLKTDVIGIERPYVVKDTVNIAVQVPKIETLVHQKLLIAPQYKQRVVIAQGVTQDPFQTVTEVPTVRTYQKVVPLEQEVPVVVQVPGPQKIVRQQFQIVKTLIEQKIVPVQKVIQEIVEVPKIIQKIVTIIQQVPKIIQVEKIVEKIVPVVKYVESQRVQNFVVEKPVEVICYVQKIVPVEVIKERLLVQKEIIEKIVTVIQRKQVIKQVQAIRQVPIYRTEVKVVDRVKQVPVVGANVQVARPVDIIKQVPLIHQKPRVQTQYRIRPVIEKQMIIKRQPVHVDVPIVLTEQRIVQVVRQDIRPVRVQIPKNLIQQKVVPLQTVRQQIVPSICIVEKIIQKIVEVPKIVEVQKIVQKIVPIPRIVQKIVQVQKIVEKIVQKIVFQRDIQQIQLIRQVPIEVEKLQVIQVPNYIVQKVQVPRIIDRDRIIQSEVIKESVRVQMIEQPPRVAIERVEVPIQLIVQKFVPIKVQEHVFFQLEKQIIVPVQVQVPTTLIQQKIVAVEHVVPIVKQVDRHIERLVEVKVEVPGRVQTVDRTVQKLFVQKDVNVVTNQIPYYNDRVVEVQRVHEKIVPIQKIIKQVTEVPYMVEKIVSQIVKIPVVHEIQRIKQVPIKTQQIVTVDRIVPRVITLNKAIAKIVDKLHQIPRLCQQMKKVDKLSERIVPEKHSTTDVQGVEVFIQRAVIEEKIKQVDKYVNVINEQLQIAERIIQKPSDPIIITEQKILQVPVIMQKIAQRIVIMPQIVQVLKYVHQVTEGNALGIALSGQIAVQQAEYQRLGKKVNGQLSKLRNVLIQLKKNPMYKDQVTIIDNFLIQFNKFILYPRIREVMTQKVVQSIVQKDRVVKVPVQSSDDERRGLASAVLIDKLLMQLRRLKQANPNSNLRLDPDIALIFGDQLEPVSSKYGNNYNQLLDEYSKSIFSKFNMYGTWTNDHQRMLKQFIDQRFELASRLNKSNKQSIKYKQLYNSLVEKSSREQLVNQTLKSKFKDLQSSVRQMIMVIVDMGMKRALEEKLQSLSQAILGFASGSDTITHNLREMSEMDKQRANSYLREKDALIIQLRATIQRLKRQIQQRGRTEVQGHLVYGNCNIHNQVIGQMQNQLNQLRRYRQLYANVPNVSSSTKTITSNQRITINNNDAELKQSQADNMRFKQQISRLKQQITRLQAQIRRLREVQATHRNFSNKVRELQQRIKIITIERDRYQKELIQIKSSSMKDTSRKTAIGSATSPQRQSMSQSYGTNYGRYAQETSQIIREGATYERTVFRSGGNYGPTSGELSIGYGKSAQSLSSGGYVGGLGGNAGNFGNVGISGGIGTNASIGMGNMGNSRISGQSIASGNSRTSGTGQSITNGMTGGISGSGAVNSGTYLQQRSANNLTESQASKNSGLSGMSRGQISNKSSRAGGVTLNYQQTFHKESSVKGSVIQSSEMSQQKLLRMDQSGSSQAFGTSSREIIQRTSRDKFE